MSHGLAEDPARIPKQELTDEQRAILGRLEVFAAKHNTRHFPSSPALVASFLDSCDAEELLTVVEAIVAAHDLVFCSNPCATSSVRAALHRRPCSIFPRSWSATDKLVFANIDEATRSIILRREHARDAGLRQAQNRLADERKKLEEERKTMGQR